MNIALWAVAGVAVGLAATVIVIIVIAAGSVALTRITAGILATGAVVLAGVAIWAWFYGDAAWRSER